MAFDPFEAWKQEYNTLRAEILQSIDKQHQIMLGGYVLTATIFGYIVSKGSQPVWQALAVIPFALLAMTSLWAVETNRMVRASYYIGKELIPVMMEESGIKLYSNWEAWVRSQDAVSKDFRTRQHHLQLIASCGIPIIVSICALALVTYHTWAKSHWVCIGLWIVVAILWEELTYQIIPISDLDGIRADQNDKKHSLMSRLIRTLNGWKKSLHRTSLDIATKDIVK
jgi:hypothetical protein